MFSKLSIQLKYSVVFLIALIMVVSGLLYGVQELKFKQLQNEAIAVANQVVSFRAWVAKSGVVWVDELSADFHDFLSQRPKAEGDGFYFSKNPALATRELSTIVEKTSSRATFRVTSDEYRNPANAPDAFESSALKIFKEDKDKKTSTAIEGGFYRYAQPIYVEKSCLRCHGSPEDAPKDVINKYGDKRAFGYKVGDVRGIISVKLPDITLIEVTKSFLNPFTLGLVIVAFLLNFAYTQRSIIHRLKLLAGTTERIARGSLDEPIEARSGSRDEVESVSHAVDMLRKSLVVAMNRLKRKSGAAEE